MKGYLAVREISYNWNVSEADLDTENVHYGEY